MHRNVRLLTWFNFFNDFRPYNPIAIIYFVQVTGSFALGLAVFSFQSIGALFFELPTGIFSDIVGRKKTIIYGALASVFSLLFFALGDSFTMLAVGGLFAGLAESLFSGNNDAFLYDTLNEANQKEEYAHVSGRVRSMFQLGLGISALLASVFTGISLAFVMWISIIPQIICFFIALFFVEPKVHADNVSANIFDHLKEALMKFKENYKLRTLSIVSMLDFGIGETMHQFSPAFLVTVWPVWALGIARTLSHAFCFFGFRYAGKLIKKFLVFRSLIGGWVGSRLSVIVAVVFPSFLSPILISFASFFFGFRIVALDTLMQREFTDKQRATMGSLNRLGANIVFAFFAYAFGTFADSVCPAKALLSGEIILLFLVGFYWKLYKKY